MIVVFSFCITLIGCLATRTRSAKRKKSCWSASFLLLVINSPLQKNLSGKEHWFEEAVTVEKRGILQDLLRGMQTEFELKCPPGAEISEVEEEDDDEVVIIE